METRKTIFALFALTLVIILAACSPQVNNSPEDQPTPTATELPAFEWRNPNPSMIEVGEPYFDKAISLVEPTLCLDDLTLEDVLRNADESMTLLFRNGSGEIPDGEYVALIDGVEKFYTCEVNAEEADLLACTGPDIPAGAEISVRFGEISGGAFENLSGSSQQINLPELWSTKQTNLEEKFDFQLADETAQLFGASRPQNLQDAYGLITASASLNVNEAIPGGGWGAPSWLLLSSLPQFQKTGQPCDSYWDCAKACAKEINYDLSSDDLLGAFDFYKNFASKLGRFLPDTCQAFNQYALRQVPMSGTPQEIHSEWFVVTSDRLELYDPVVETFDLYDWQEQWSARAPLDLIPAEVLACAESIGYPHDLITDIEDFLNWYFSFVGVNNYSTTPTCSSTIITEWIKKVTADISENPGQGSNPSDPLFKQCADAIGYSGPFLNLGDEIAFLEWLFEIWASSPSNVPLQCGELLISDWWENLLNSVEFRQNWYSYNSEPICSTKQEAAIQAAVQQFRNEISSCDSGTCENYDQDCQEHAFVNSLLRDGIIDGPSTCLVNLPLSCLEYTGQTTYVPPEVWECAVDNCYASSFPLQRGDGIHAMATWLNERMESDPFGLPTTCRTHAVLDWLDHNLDCGVENYTDSSMDYSRCGRPYIPNYSQICLTYQQTDNGIYTICYPPPTNQYCPSCSTVYQCAEGEESIFCNESPEGEDPGYWGQLNLCAEQIDWEGGLQTYKDASDLVQYLITAAPFLKVDDIPAACKVSVDQTLIAGLPYGEFLTKLTLGGKVEGSTVCSEAKQFTIPEETTVDRCAAFNPSQYRLSLHDIPYNSNLVTLYLTIPGGVPGLEREVPEDTRPWEYSGLLGNTEAVKCGFYDYPNRLFCTFEVPQTYMETVRPLQISVNGCEIPFYSHPSVSIIPEEPPKESGSGNVCVQPPPPPGPCWIWFQDECKWQCVN